MGTGLQHDMASRDDLAQMSDLALFSAFNQNFHLSPRVHHSSVGEEEGTSIDTPTPLSLFTQRHFSRYVVTRGCGVGGTWINRGRVRALRTCTVWNALPKQGLNYCKLQELGVFFVFRKENIIHANYNNFSRPVLYTWTVIDWQESWAPSILRFYENRSCQLPFTLSFPVANSCRNNAHITEMKENFFGEITFSSLRMLQMYGRGRGTGQDMRARAVLRDNQMAI